MNYDSFEIAMLIKEIYSRTIEVLSESLKESKLTHQQVMVIKLIAHNKRITISELCEELSLSKGTVSGIISRLEKMGYVEKQKDENDKRNTYIVFSDKGLEFARVFRTEINKSFDKIFKNVSDEEMKDIKKHLLMLRDKIKED